MKIIFRILLVFISHTCFAASFDCTQAKSQTEIAICSNDELSKLDDQIAVLYGTLKAKLPETAQLTSEQSAWLTKRDSCGSDINCLSTNMQARIGELSQQDSSISQANSVPNISTKPKEDSSWIGSLLILGGLIGGVIWVVIKIIRFYKNMKFRSLVNKNYESINQIGTFVDSSKFIAAHGASVGKKASNAEIVEFIPALLHISKPTSSNSGTWTAQIGYFDAASFNNATMHYQSAHQQWKIGKAQFDQQEELMRKQAEMMKQHYSKNWYSIKEPKKPNKNDFITYTPQSGSCSANLQHGYIVSSGNTEFPSNKCGSFVVDIDKIQKNIISIYSKLLDRIYSGQITIQNDPSVLTFANLLDQPFYDKLSKDVSNALLSDAKRFMGEYHKDLKIANFNGNFERNEILVPIAIVVAKMPEGKTNYTIHDHLFPEIVLS